MRKKSILLLIFLCALLISIDVKATTDFYVTSDVQVGPTTVTSCSAQPWYCVNNGADIPLKTNAARFSEFLQAINLTGATNRYLLVVGDIIQIYQGDDAYSNYKSLINSSTNKSSSDRVYTAIGNHALRPGSEENGILTNDQYKTKRNAFISNFGDIRSSKEFAGIKVIRIGTDYENAPVSPWTEEYDDKDIPEDFSSLYGYASDEMLEDLENELQASEEAGQTVIVMTHWPLNNTVEYSWYNSSDYGVMWRNTSLEEDDALNRVIEKHPNAIVVSGHSHWKLNGWWKLVDTETRSISKTHALLLHNGNGIKGTPNNGTTEFLKISFTDNKTVTVYPQELSWDGQTISTISRDATPSAIKQFEWSWASIDYNANGGTGTVPKSGFKFENAAENSLTRSGYKFLNWNTKADGTGTSYNPGDRVGSGDIVLYANWVNESKNIIRYVLNGGSNNDNNPITFDTGEELELYSPTKKGNTFIGWYLDSNYETKVSRISKDMSGDITLYARWVKNSDVRSPKTGLRVNEVIIILVLLLIVISSYYISKRYKPSNEQ